MTSATMALKELAEKGRSVCRQKPEPRSHAKYLWRKGTFKTEQEAVDAANDTEFGLASYFYSRDVGRIFRVSEALEYGMVGINVGIIATEHVPFGGVSSRAWAARARTTASTSTWRSSTSASATC
jgi:hypothetical protein